LDFAAAIGNKSVKADPEIAYASGNNRPKRDTWF
jgi:hypothetical protein